MPTKELKDSEKTCLQQMKVNETVFGEMAGAEDRLPVSVPRTRAHTYFQHTGTKLKRHGNGGSKE